MGLIEVRELAELFYGHGHMNPHLNLLRQYASMVHHESVALHLRILLAPTICLAQKSELLHAPIRTASLAATTVTISARI